MNRIQWEDRIIMTAIISTKYCTLNTAVPVGSTGSTNVLDKAR